MVLVIVIISQQHIGYSFRFVDKTTGFSSWLSLSFWE